MQTIIVIAGMLAVVGILVGVPLAVLRSIDEIKAGQRRLEARLVALEAQLSMPDGVG